MELKRNATLTSGGQMEAAPAFILKSNTRRHSGSESCHWIAASLMQDEDVQGKIAPERL